MAQTLNSSTADFNLQWCTSIYMDGHIRAYPRKNSPPWQKFPPLFCSSGRLDLVMAPQAKILGFWTWFSIDFAIEITVFRVQKCKIFAPAAHNHVKSVHNHWITHNPYNNRAAGAKKIWGLRISGKNSPPCSAPFLNKGGDFCEDMLWYHRSEIVIRNFSAVFSTLFVH